MNIRSYVWFQCPDDFFITSVKHFFISFHSITYAKQSLYQKCYQRNVKLQYWQLSHEFLDQRNKNVNSFHYLFLSRIVSWIDSKIDLLDQERREKRRKRRATPSRLTPNKWGYNWWKNVELLSVVVFVTDSTLLIVIDKLM